MYNGCANPKGGTEPWCPTVLIDGIYIDGSGKWGLCNMNLSSCKQKGQFTEVGGLMLNFHETPARYEEAVESCSDIGSRLVEIRDVGTGEQVHT